MNDQTAPRAALTPERARGYRDRVIDAAILGLPLLAVDWGLGKLSAVLTSQPWHVLWFVVPLAVLAWILWRRVMSRGTFRVRGAMLAFLICYLSAFTLAAASNLLVWSHSTQTFEEAVAPRRWLLPAGWGDWRYRFARRPSPEDRLLVLTMEAPPEGASLSAVRYDLANLIQMGANDSALGIAFDFYFGSEASNMDAFLCSVVNQSGIPVMAGRRIRKGDLGTLFAEPYAPSIEPCFPAPRRGQPLAYRDADGVVRNVLLRARDVGDSLALSLRVARELGAAPTTATLLQFVEPKNPLPSVEYERLTKVDPAQIRDRIKGRFLLVGERSPLETFHTPFGDRSGVEVHAAAIASLLGAGGIVRPPWWSSVLIVFIGCYLIAAFAAEGARAWKLVAVATGISAFVVLAAASAMRLWLVWLDVIYPLTAVWLLLGLLLALRRKLGAAAHRA